MTIDILNIVNEWVLLIAQYKQRETQFPLYESITVATLGSFFCSFMETTSARIYYNPSMTMFFIMIDLAPEKSFHSLIFSAIAGNVGL
jgi:hypothetical protein